MFSLFFLYASCSSEDALKTFNANPTISIGSHSDGSQVQEGYETQFWAQVGDSDNTHDELFVLWYFNQEEICPETNPDVSGQALCTARIEENGTLTAQVRDNQDAGANDSIALLITPTNAPTAQIIAPTGDSPLYSDRLITFEGQASDTEDEAEQLSVWWESSIDGALSLSSALDSSGNTTSAGYLSEGEHLVQFFVQDQSETRASDSVTLQVGGPNQGPECNIVSPSFESIFLEGETILFEAMVSDAELSPSLLTVSWESDKDGSLGDSTPSTQGEVFFSTTLSVNTHTITLSVQDELGAICTTPVVVTIGTAPLVTIDAPINGSVINQGESTVFTGTIQDSTDAISQVSISWESDIDGTISTAPASSSGISQFATTTLSPGFHNILCTATDLTGLSGQDSIQVYVNQPPLEPVVLLSPSSPYTADDLEAIASSTDPDGDLVSYTYQWQKDGHGTTHTNSSIPASSTTKGEIWTVNVTANDGAISSASVAASVEIQNTAPTINSTTITPVAPSNQDTLTCAASVTDPDETPSLSYSWADASSSIISTSSTLPLNPSMAQGGDVFSCSVVATDSDGATDSSLATITVQNTAPVIQLVTITPAQPVNDDTVTCSSVASDADHDSLSESYTWSNNTTGQILGTGQTLTLSSSTISPNHELQCAVSVSDPNGGSDTSDASVILSNRAPLITQVSLSPNPLYNTDHVICTITSADPDGDARTESFTWSNQTTSAVLATTSSLTLTPTDISPQELLLCSASVSDPHGGTASMDHTTLIENRVPSLSSASITPTSPTSTDDLNCSATGGTDQDGQSVSFQYRWYRNGILSTQSSSTLYAPHTKGETVTCGIIPDDGIATGAEVSTSVSISNSHPSITSLSILPSPIYTTETAFLDISAIDQDGDAITFAYDWTINAALSGTSAILDSSLFSRGDVLEVTVTPADSLISGQPQIASITVSNTPPSQPQIELPSAPKEGIDDLVCAVLIDSIDHDGDSISYSISWDVDGIPYTGVTQTTNWTGDTISSSLTSVGEEWTCTATPNDSFDDGTPGSATTTIQNAYTRVFVTSSTWNGDLGGLSGADDKCQQSADDVGLGGSWVAFLSNGTSASSRIPEGPYVRLDESLIANDKSDLLDGSIMVPINLNEVGGTTSGFVFTGSNASGNSYGSSTNGLCVGWTRGCGVCYGNHFYAQVGRADRNNDDWVDVGWVKCHTGSHLYCFEQ